MLRVRPTQKAKEPSPTLPPTDTKGIVRFHTLTRARARAYTQTLIIWRPTRTNHTRVHTNLKMAAKRGLTTHACAQTLKWRPTWTHRTRVHANPKMAADVGRQDAR